MHKTLRQQEPREYQHKSETKLRAWKNVIPVKYWNPQSLTKQNISPQGQLYLESIPI